MNALWKNAKKEYIQHQLHHSPHGNIAKNIYLLTIHYFFVYC